MTLAQTSHCDHVMRSASWQGEKERHGKPRMIFEDLLMRQLLAVEHSEGT